MAAFHDPDIDILARILDVGVDVGVVECGFNGMQIDVIAVRVLCWFE